MNHSESRDNGMTLSDMGKEATVQEVQAVFVPKSQGAEKPNFENVYDLIGGFGRFQKVYIGLLLISGERDR